MIVVILFMIAVLAPQVATQYNCNTLVCNPCGTVPLADIVFVIDASVSMQNEIDTVALGLETFVKEIVKRDINARYAIVLFGNQAELVVDFTADGTFVQTQFKRIKAGATVANFEAIVHNPDEASFEAIRMVLGKATNNTFLHKFVGGNGRLSFRTGAKKFLIMVTDENSDRPHTTSNRLTNQKSREPWGSNCPAGSATSVCENRAWTYTTGPWARELNNTVQALIDTRTSINMFINRNTNPSIQQFGNPTCDVSGANFQGYNQTATLACLRTNGLGLSLQGQILAANRNLTARTFDILKISDPGVIQDFFTFTATLLQDDCQKKRTVEGEIEYELVERQTPAPCINYFCSATQGCYEEYTCATNCMQCNIGGRCYYWGEQNPANPCETCNPVKSKTSWDGCYDFNDCTIDTCNNGRCEFTYNTTACEASCGFCNIPGAGCIRVNTVSPSNACLRCKPDVSATAWTDTCNPVTQQFETYTTDDDDITVSTPTAGTATTATTATTQGAVESSGVATCVSWLVGVAALLML